MRGLAAAVMLQAAGTAPSLITNPDWIRRPSGSEIARYYPRAAAAAQIEGSAAISCKVSAAGFLVDCTVLDERPAGHEFGQAALALSTSFRMRPMLRDGAPVEGGTVRIPMQFKLPPQDSGSGGPPTWAQVTRCYAFSFSALEAGPSSDENRGRFAAWRVVYEMKLISEGLKPTEIDARLVSARNAPAAPGSPPDLAACDRIIGSAGLAIGRGLAAMRDVR
jgi:TonB family protein